MTGQELRTLIPFYPKEIPVWKTAFCDLSVVIPARNEEDRLPTTITRLLQVLGSLKVSHELVIVDDGSKDDTAHVAESLGACVITHSRCKGIAAAFRSGAAISIGDVVMLCPADIEDFTFLTEAISASRGFDVVSVSKRHPRSIVLGYNKWRWFLSNNYQRLVTLLFGKLETATDTHYIKLYNGVMLRSIINKCQINGPVGETEIILYARDAGCSFFEVPAKIMHNGNGSKTSFKLILRTISELVRLWIRRR